MKIIFLDIDGVLNSDIYKASRLEDCDDNFIDLSRVKLLKDIVNATDAKIVLTSSLRIDWDKSSEMCGDEGKYINRCLAEHGLSVMDKTPFFNLFDHRRKEILAWLKEHYNHIESFVILDDINFGWDVLLSRVVITNPCGYGLEEIHVKKAIDILNKPANFKN